MKSEIVEFIGVQVLFTLDEIRVLYEIINNGDLRNRDGKVGKCASDLVEVVKRHIDVIYPTVNDINPPCTKG